MAMIYLTPPITPALQQQLDELAKLRAALGREVKTSSRWMGSLRREIRASSIESSTSIEGFSVSPEEALALTNNRDVADRDQENRQAVACYARAMDHVGTMAVDPSFQWVDRVILDLHFDACYFQRDKGPGLWRSGPVGVTAPDGSLEYEGPDSERVVALMEEVVEARNWPDRLVIALEQSLAGGTDRGKYGEEADVSPATASADFRRLLDAGLVEQRGRGRNISYLASERLRDTLKDASDAD